MSVADELRAHAPDTGTGAGGGGPAARRILVPVRLAADAGPALALAASLCDTASGMLRLVHVRIYDPPVRGGARFYPQTAAEAAAVVDEAMLTVWGWGLRADSVVVKAPRGKVADAIAAEAGGWNAHVIVLTRQPRTAVSRLLWGSVPDRVMRKSGCPVLAVHPGRT